MSLIESTDVVAPAIARPKLSERLRLRTAAYPRNVWLIALAVLTLWTGRGMVTPFLIIYFSQIVGISSSIVGLVIAGTGLIGVISVFFVAGQIDKRGGRPILLTSLGFIAIATLSIAWTHSTWSFFLAALLLYCASQSYWPAIDTVITANSEPNKVIPAMALVRVAMSVGIGLGGLVGGVMVAGGGLTEYRLLFIVSALLVALGAFIIWRVVPNTVPQHATDTGKRGSWGDVIADRTFIYGLVVLFSLVLGFTQLNMSVPPFLRAEAGIGEGTIGALFFINTVLVVLTQVPVAARVDRGNVGWLLALASVIWGLAFLTMMATPGFGGAAVLVFIGFTAGEVIFMPLTAILAVRLAPVHLRGRYFSLLSITWGTSWAIATLTAGVALDLPRPILLWPIMASMMLLGGAAALRLRRTGRLDPPALPSVGD